MTTRQGRDGNLDDNSLLGLVSGMAEYTIALQLGDDPQTVTLLVTAESFAQAKKMGFDQFERLSAEQGSVSVGRGHDNVEWVEAFYIEPGIQPREEAAE